MFGALNAVFTGLAFAGVIATLRFQRNQLKLQELEIAESRRMFQQQSDENTFFNIFAIYKTSKEGLLALTPDKRTLAKVIHDDIKYHFRLDTFYSNSNHKYQDVTKVCDWLHQDYGSSINDCFRTLYYLIKFTDGSSLSSEQYTQLIRSQLNNDELVILFYSGLSNHIADDFKFLIEKHGLLKHTDQYIPHHKARYHHSAYA